MNYRHIYHAGSFADVFKHTLLVALIEALQKKSTPFCVLDTHAGIGLYPLLSKEAQKKREYDHGIIQLINVSSTSLPDTIQHYLSIVKSYNQDSELNNYPGSPAIIRHLLCDHDKMILCELHASDIQLFKNLFAKDRQVAAHHTDGYLGLKAFLPPKERRGLVLIDPPFETKDEWTKIDRGMQEALHRWKNGIYAIWYPIKKQLMAGNFSEKLTHYQLPYLKIEFFLNNATDITSLTACGMIILNPPWQLKEKLTDSVLPCLGKILDARWTIS